MENLTSRNQWKVTYSIVRLFELISTQLQRAGKDRTLVESDRYRQRFRGMTCYLTEMFEEIKRFLQGMCSSELSSFSIFPCLSFGIRSV